MARRRIRRTSGNRRFRKRRGLWLPTLGQSWSNGEQTHWDAAFTWDTLSVPDQRGLGPSQIVIPLVPDFTLTQNQAAGEIGASLHDRVQGNEWRLDRIVGSCHAQCKEVDDTAEGQWPYIQVTAGIFVARAEEGSPGNADVDLFSDEYDPQNASNIQNPWVWRKTWMLANPVGIAVLRDDFPISNSAYGSQWMDASVDVKAKRRIRREHRLWFTVSAIGWDGTNQSVTTLQTNPSARGLLDIRLFGGMIQNPRPGSSF